MSRNYKFRNQEKLYFVTFTVINWIDVFIRPEYKNIIVDSLNYCSKNKGLEVYAWCIMTSHVHLIFRIVNGLLPELVIGDIKRFTSKKIVNEIKENPRESRKEFLLAAFKEAATKQANVKGYQFWQHDNHPIELWSPAVTQQKINYIHWNPVEACLVYRPEDYVYSSARDYSEEKGLLNDVIVVR
jgi:REP element-mobilizing transposase RayT